MDDRPSPFAGLDYPAGERPSPSLGPLAKDLRELYGVSGAASLTAAILLDQGDSVAALTLLDKEVARLEAVDEERKARREQRGKA